MNKQRILKEAQNIASKYSFWMVSGDITHLYGYVFKTEEKEYDLEIKFTEFFPTQPPQLIYHDNIKNLLGDIKLEGIINWNESFQVLNLLDEVNSRIKKEISPEENESLEENLINYEDLNSQDDQKEEYITPDLNLYPPEMQEVEYVSSNSLNDDFFYTDGQDEQKDTYQNPDMLHSEDIYSENSENLSQDDSFIDSDSSRVDINTELGLIQQEYAYDKKGGSNTKIIVYMTITLTKTFLINIDFSNYPEKPNITFSEKLQKIIKNPDDSLKKLKQWDKRKPFHIIDVLHELESKLYKIKDIENQLKKIAQEYQYTTLPENITVIRIKLVTYGFQEYKIKMDIGDFPKPPIITLSSELRNLIRIPIRELESLKSWDSGESEPIEVIREIDWLVDKNSRINFELDLLDAANEKVNYDPLTNSFTVNMKGKMKTKDLTFKFRIDLPPDYPMSMPKVSVTNKFELESHEQIKQDLNQSFEDFFSEWSPFSYLIDLFNLISKKIFEVSAISCVICHQIECPVCHLKVAASDEQTCYIECPHCERPYHKHCWDQTIESFGKCGFCLKPP
jgi:ubiquitin-protein ligase